MIKSSARYFKEKSLFNGIVNALFYVIYKAIRRPFLSYNKIGSTRIYFNKYHDITTREYYLYVTELISRSARSVLISDADIIIGHYLYYGTRLRRIFNVDFQIEHTLVKPGGRGSLDAPSGCVPILGHPAEKYLVRLQDLDRLTRADAIIEYSRPNFENVRISGLYPDLAARMYHISPLIYPIVFEQSIEGRDLEVITLFGNPEEPRRKVLLEQLRKLIPICQNVQGHFEDVRAIYRRTRILVNVRQTECHDTFEELRVLPALLSGVIVINEEAPLCEDVPYKDFVLWAPISEIPALVHDVHQNYSIYFARIFSPPTLQRCLVEMSERNKNNILNLLHRLEGNPPMSG